MLKVMIADDERIIRETISKLIDWQSLGLELIGQCRNGTEAYDMILDESPDIVLTDIRMPGLSGIELIANINATHHDTQFILLSGYGEFDYARDAMKYGVRHYLLKPCSEEQIIASLREAIRECYDRRAAQRPEQSAEREALYRSVILEVLNEMAMITDNCYERAYEPYRKYLDFDNTPYVAVYFHHIKEADIQSCYDAVRQYLRKCAPGLPLHGVYIPGTLMVFCQDINLERLQSRELLDSLSRRGDEVVFTREGHLLPNLRTLLDELWDKARHYGTIRYMDEQRSVPTCNYRGVIHSVKKLCQELCSLQRTPDPEAQKEKLAELTEMLGGVTNYDFLLQLCSSVLLSFSNDSLFCSPVEATERMIALQSCESADEMYELFLSQLRELTESGATRGQNELVARIQRCVSENLSNPELTLKWISEKYLFMNVDYVSRKFVRETGEKFSKYLTDARIQRAKSLLADGDVEKIQFIAEQVGCGNNPQYFSQIFKKNTGMTPSAYARVMGSRQRGTPIATQI